MTGLSRCPSHVGRSRTEASGSLAVGRQFCPSSLSQPFRASISTCTSASARSSGPHRKPICPSPKLGFAFLKPMIFGPAFLLGSRNPLSCSRAHGALLPRCYCGCGLRRRGWRFATQLPPNVGDLFFNLVRLMLIPDQRSFQKGLVVGVHRAKCIIERRTSEPKF